MDPKTFQCCMARAMVSLPSPRWLQWACAVALMGSTGSAGVIPATPMITVDSPLPWLEITTAGDERFGSLVAKAVRSDVTEVIGGVLPYSVVVAHNGLETLIGLDVRFTVILTDRTVYRNFFFNSFSQPERPLMPPGRVMLFTPLLSANAIAGGAKAGGTGGGRPRSRLADDSTIKMLKSAREIHVSIDLAIAQDGRTAGPDSARMVKELTRQMDAYTTMRGECLAKLARGIPDEVLQSWLDPLSKQNLRQDKDTGRTDGYFLTQARLAKQWLSYLSSGRRQDLVATLSAQPPEVTYSVVASLKGGLQ